MEHRSTTYRLIPGTKAKAAKLATTAGACRWVWNTALAENQKAYEAYKAGKGDKPSVTFYSLGKLFTQTRKKTPWLQELSCAAVRHTLKFQAEAWKRALAGAGHPRFKARRGTDSVTFPDKRARIKGKRIRLEKIGWCILRRHGQDPYCGHKVFAVTIKRVLGRWHAVVQYEVPDMVRNDNGRAVGIDRNTGQLATSEGEIIHCPDVADLEARARRYSRMMARRKKGSGRRTLARHRYAHTMRRLANIRKNWCHHVSRRLADGFQTVIVEALNTKGMTRTAKGTSRCPGKNVKAKAGLNRVILASGWGKLQQFLEYKAGELLAVPPAYTSQTCHKCGHVDKANRPSQSRFECTCCGHKGNADINAALNILALGMGATGRREALASATLMNRQQILQSVGR